MLRAGDLVHLTVPDGGRQVFEFDPVPVEHAMVYAGSATSVEYLANFIAMNGSGATLSFGFRQFFPYPQPAGAERRAERLLQPQR